MAESVKNRAWVKNAAIIFLAVMLVLTLFSNTIMNRALPEVAAQYATSGTITSKVRATAEVKANMTFNVTAAETREVDSVAVKTGDMIEAGDVLYYLKDEESEELKTAQKTLEDLELAYQKALLALPVPDYSDEERDLKEKQEDLALLKQARSDSVGRDSAVKAAKSAVDAAQDRVEDLTEKQADINEQISELGDRTPAIRSYKAAVTEAEKALKAAQEELEALKSKGDPDAAAEEIRSIQQTLEDQQLQLSRLVEDLNNAQAKDAQKIGELQMAVDAAQLKFPPAYEVAYAIQSLNAARNQYNSLLSNLEQNPDYAVAVNNVKYAQMAYDDAQRELDDAKAAYDTTWEEYYRYTVINGVNADYQRRLDEAKQRLDQAKSSYSSAEFTLTQEQRTLSLMETSTSIAQADVENAQAALDALNEKIAAAQEEWETAFQALIDYTGADNIGQQRAIEDQQIQINRTLEKLAKAQDEYNVISSYDSTRAALQSKVDAAQAALEQAQDNYDAALENANAELKARLDEVKTQLKAANRSLSDAQDRLTKAQSEAGLSTEEMDKQILSQQRAIEAAEAALAQKKEADLKAAKQNDLDIAAQEKQIDEQKALVEKYKQAGSGATINSQYAGMVSSLSAVAGDTVSIGSTVAVIEVVEKGYSMEFPVTNEQAKLIRPGDKASINSWWYNDVSVTVSALKNDPANPGKGRIVVCDVSGDGSVTVGQSLSIVLGERGATYDIVVPNSAIREDSNGKFVLVVESRPGPLSNRYIATRYDVTVVASDDSSSAISGALYGSEFIITTSTKPIEAGQQVRLVES